MKMKWRNRIALLLVLSSVILSACAEKEQMPNEPLTGPSEPSINSSMYYQADEGELDVDASLKVQEITKEQALQAGKTILTMVSSGGANDPTRLAVKGFNQESEKYFVDLTISPMGAELRDTRLKLQLEVGSGKGPDIMSVDVFLVNYEILEKGTFVDLAPYMQASGITEEKYFPYYADLQFENNVYGICPTGSVGVLAVKSNVLGGEEIKDIECFVDKLLEYPENACFFFEQETGSSIVEYLISGSEDLWGIIDWEKRQCDFSNELFGKILDVAKRYSENAKKGYEPITESFLPYVGIFPGKKAIEEQGWTLINYFFDDGCHPKYYSNSALMINSNSENVDGAWAFLSYLMSKKGQNLKGGSYSVHRELFAESVENDFKRVETGELQMTIEMTEEIVADIIELHSTGHFIPRRTDDIRNIIYDEAEAFFSGEKSKEEVCSLIQNRVQLLLMEQ